MENKPTILFNFDIDFFADEVEMKGYCDGVTVTLPNMFKYNVCFYDPVRLKQDIDDELYIAIPNLIIITDVTKQNMEKAIYESWKDGFFNNIKPL